MIIVDDGSTDETRSVISSVGDMRIKYIYQENKGQSWARNTAIAAARGRYIAFLDADDFFLPTKLEEQVRYLEEHPECGLSYCKILHFFEDDAQQLYYFALPHPSGFIFEDLLRTSFINPLTVVLRKSILDAHGSFEPNFRRVDEQYLWLKLAYHTVQFCYLDKPLGLYRVHSESLSNEAVYFIETEQTLLKLFEHMRGWMSVEEVERHGLDAAERRVRKRILFGKLIAGKRIFSRAIRAWYHWRRN